MHSFVRSVNTILYCERFEETVDFYRNTLDLPVRVDKGWFIEFEVGGGARLSIADDSRCTVKSAQGAGVTVTIEVEDVQRLYADLSACGLDPGPLRDHPWGARAFFLRDPEGHRIEFWSN